MSVLSVIQGLSAKIGVSRPAAIFGSTEREHFELADMANDTADYIARLHEWQALKRRYTITGNGATDAYALPDGYDRMPVVQRVWTDRLQCPLEGPVDHDVWLGRLTRREDFSLGSWTLLGGAIAFNPVLADGETASFYYLEGSYAIDADDMVKPAFTADDDLFRLDERLLRLGIIWRWRMQKGMPYAEDLGDFEALLSYRIGKDGGPKVIAAGRRARTCDIEVAYPRTIGQ